METVKRWCSKLDYVKILSWYVFCKRRRLWADIIFFVSEIYICLPYISPQSPPQNISTYHYVRTEIPRIYIKRHSISRTFFMKLGIVFHEPRWPVMHRRRHLSDDFDDCLWSVNARTFSAIWALKLRQFLQTFIILLHKTQFLHIILIKIQLL